MAFTRRPKSIFVDVVHPDKSDCRALLAEPEADNDFYLVSYTEHRRQFEIKLHEINGGRALEGHSGEVKDQFRFYYWLTLL